MKTEKDIKKEIDTTIHFILTGVLMNGFFQGRKKDWKLENSVLQKAGKEIAKRYKITISQKLKEQKEGIVAAVEDFYTQAPKYRTKEEILKIIK